VTWISGSLSTATIVFFIIADMPPVGSHLGTEVAPQVATLPLGSERLAMALLRISAHSVPSFRSKPFTHFGPSRSVVSLQAVHPFRSKPIR
jgi:hypothetical protein